jgi:hypothetical protein
MAAWWVRRFAVRPLYWLALALFVTTAAAHAVADEAIVVRLDEARIIKVPERASTVVIGNPLIADLSVQPGGLAVVTGKSYGGTNLIVMDKTGAVLSEQTVQVEGSGDKTVVVYRGVSRQTYSCTPNCSPRLTLGDDVASFKDVMTELTTRNTQSLAAGAGGSH